MSSPDPAAADLVRRFARELAARIPDARRDWLPGADHYVMEERPAEVLGALERWLAR
jgi:pimeloyl-ACP methyl ester carboxylesterase